MSEGASPSLDHHSNNNNNVSTPSPRQIPSYQHPSSPLKPYNLHSWRPNPNRSADENYMDIVMFLTRSSKLRQGSMGCVIVNRSKAAAKDNKGKDNASPIGQKDEEKEGNTADFYKDILAASTNQSLFKPFDSDIHAEISTLGQCLQNGKRTKGCTAYITMPPCKKCFGALVAAGIGRIVSGRDCSKAIQDGAKDRNIELVSMSREFSDDQKNRINELIRSDNKGNDAALKIWEERTRRKEDRKRRSRGTEEDRQSNPKQLKGK